MPTCKTNSLAYSAISNRHKAHAVGPTESIHRERVQQSAMDSNNKVSQTTETTRAHWQ